MAGSAGADKYTGICYTLLLKILFQENQISNRLSNRGNKYVFHGRCGETLWGFEISHLKS